VSLSRIVKGLKANTSREYGESLFQKSFYDHVIRDEADFLRVYEYINNNPIRWVLDRYYIP
jgi:REP element-mobilizing transposase RayT